MLTFREYVHELQFLIRHYEYYLIFLFLIAVIIGFIDAFSIALLYPMLSVGFQIHVDDIPFYGYVQNISSYIPIGSTFVHLGFMFIFLTGLSLFLQLLYWKIGFVFQREIVIGIKNSLFLKINQNDYQFFIDKKQGDLINLFNQSPYYVQQSYDRILSLFTDLISSLTIFAMLFVISPGGLILVLLGGSIFYIVLHLIGNNISIKLGNLQIASGQSENKVINEYITGIKSITSLNASKYWGHQYTESLKIYWDRFAEFMFIQRIPILAINSFFYITIGLVVLVLYVFFADDFIIVVPILGTFSAGMMKVLPKFLNMGNYKLELKNYTPHVHNVYSNLIDSNYNHIKNGNLECKGINSDIIIDNISFSYGHTTVLNNVSICIQKGSMTALVGPSGSGKSTIVNLLIRLYDPDNGAILVNSENLKSFDINSYRSIIGYVSQDPFIFNDTIRKNIEFGGQFSDIELINASMLSHAHNFISTLPQGYDTIVGDQGVTLSGGEKQRIVIARAMIRNPDLLILDEATSALDNISEAAVQQAIDQVSKKCTTLVIAHRLSTIRNANSIVVLEQGNVLEVGNHEDLMEKKGKYWELNLVTEEK